MNDNKDNRSGNAENAENESNAARRIRILGQDTDEHDETPLEINKWSNFWYHHKTKVIMTAFFTFVILVGVVQLVSRSNPDVYVFYSGPEYITPNQNTALCDALEDVMDDYNGDGKVYAQLNDLVFMTESQIEEYEAEMEAKGDTATVDRLANKDTYERFIYEIFGENSSICILADDQYEMVKSEGGFMELSGIFDEIPACAIDQFGIKLSETKFAKFYTAFGIFPEDTTIALRRLSTLSALTGKSKAEKRYEYHLDLFKKIVEFAYPEGFTPPEETETE